MSFFRSAKKPHKTVKEVCREWLDTLVVAISVAMAFRAYFYEPFNIPTGSMQTTLWGHHAQAGGTPGTWDAFPLSVLKWLWTGEKFVEVKAERSGSVQVVDCGDGYCEVSVGASRSSVKLPADVGREIKGRFVPAGATVWKGTVKTGDFIFVNRWRWNFFKPQVDEVMIFATTGIEGLPQGTHYIKRLKATPGQTYFLEHPVSKVPPGVSYYTQNCASVTMREGEYFACGDNFDNSYDSRYWGPVPVQNLRGVGSVVFWPFNGWRKIR